MDRHLYEMRGAGIAKTVKTGQECMLELSVETGVKKSGQGAGLEQVLSGW